MILHAYPQYAKLVTMSLFQTTQCDTFLWFISIHVVLDISLNTKNHLIALPQVNKYTLTVNLLTINYIH